MFILMGFFSEFFLSNTSQFYQEAEFSCRTHQKSIRKPWNKENVTNFLAENILSENSLLNRLKFVNYMKNSSCRTPQNKLPEAKHRENTCLVCATRWLLSEIFRWLKYFRESYRIKSNLVANLLNYFKVFSLYLCSSIFGV